MPYRYAHHVILLVLAPVILFAFWPHYFGDLPHAPFAFHAHGVTATAWVLLVAGQSWTVHSRRFALHRALGRAVFVLVPLFAGGAALAVQSMATKFVTQSDPFYAALGPMLGVDDLVSTVALVGLVRAALVSRRRAHLHGGYLLATVMLVVPPIVSRLNIPVSPAWHLGEAISIAPAVALLVLHPKHARPFLVLIALVALKALADAVFGFSAVWLALFTRLPGAPSLLLAGPAMALAFAALWTAWRPAWWLSPAARRATA